MATATIAESRDAIEPLAMTDAVVLLAVIFLAIAALANCLCERFELLKASLLRLWPLIVKAANASADSLLTSDTSLEADAVELATLAALAVAAAGSHCNRGLAAHLQHKAT